MPAVQRAISLSLLVAFLFSSIATLDPCGTIKPCDCQHRVTVVEPIQESTRSCHGESNQESKANPGPPCCDQCWIDSTHSTGLDPRPVSLLKLDTNLTFAVLVENSSIYSPPSLSAKRSMASERGQPPPGFLTLLHNLSPPSFLA